jgi:glycosyltransferase involved in cell wall biosynthesis
MTLPMTIDYLANARLPTEKAHGLQIVENCDALAAAGAEVTLIVPRRRNAPALAGADLWMHYGVPRRFALRRVFCLDLFRLGPGFERAAAVAQTLTYTLSVLLTLRTRTPDAIYSRDVWPLVALSLAAPERILVYEGHSMARSRLGSCLQRRCLRRATTTIAVTDHLAEAYRRLGARRVVVLRDGYRADRFAAMPDRGEARRRTGLPAGAWLIGYVGQLHTMGLAKGCDELVEAIAMLDAPGVHLCVVGGPPERLAGLRALWARRGLGPERLHMPGSVAPPEIPAYLAAFDACAMPFPWTPHFAYSASPLKLFEYMAAGRPIVASALPAIAEVLRDGENALLVPPGDVPALAEALARLRDDGPLGKRLAATARRDASAFAYDARAARLLEELERSAAPAGTGAAASGA